MSNKMPIYSHVTGKGKHADRARRLRSGEPEDRLASGHEHRLQDAGGGDRKEVRRSTSTRRLRDAAAAAGAVNTTSDSKVEAYLRCNTQHNIKHNTSRMESGRSKEKTSDRQRKEHDSINMMSQAEFTERIGKAVSTLERDNSGFYCRDWVFDKLAHCLEKGNKSIAGALILGDAGSGKTAICQELSSPGSGPACRQQRALNRRLLARHFMESQNEGSLSVCEFIRSLAMQVLSHSTDHGKGVERDKKSPVCPAGPTRMADTPNRPTRERRLEVHDDEKPLLESEDQRTDTDDEVSQSKRVASRTSGNNHCTEIQHNNKTPRLCPRQDKVKSTNPFVCESESLYENHENIFLRNQSSDARSSRCFKVDQDATVEESTTKPKKNDDSSCSANESNSPSSAKISRIPVANFRYPNKSNLSDGSPVKMRHADDKDHSERPVPSRREPRVEQPEYLNVLSKNSETFEFSNGVSDSRSFNELNDLRNGTRSNNTPADIADGVSFSKQCGTFSKNRKSDDSFAQGRTKNGTKFDDPFTRKGDDHSRIGKFDDNLMKNCESNQAEITANLNAGENIDSILKFDDNFSKNCEMAHRNIKFEEIPAGTDLRTPVSNESPPPIPSLPVNSRTLIANAYREKLISETEIQEALLVSNLERNPDECFKKGFLFPLLELDPPKQCLFILVDCIDETQLCGSLKRNNNEEARKSKCSGTIGELLSNHYHLFPQWLLLVCTARKQSKTLTKSLSGFRKITIDDSNRWCEDVQRYVLWRVSTEPRLRQRVSRDSSDLLQNLGIKSDGCLLYLQKVLDGVSEGFIALREIKEIPGTLNGLYLWLCQRLFHGRRFNKVRVLLEVLLTAKCGVTEEMLYKCCLAVDYTISREEFNRRMSYLTRRSIVKADESGCVRIFHASFSRWLLDVKHCTRRYLCRLVGGHAANAMYYTLNATRLSPMEVHNYVYHMTRLEHYLQLQSRNKNDDPEYVTHEVLDLHTIMLLWLLDSGCDIDSIVMQDAMCDSVVQTRHTDKSEAVAGDVSWVVETVLGGGGQVMPRDVKVQRTLQDLTMSTNNTNMSSVNTAAPIVKAESVELLECVVLDTIHVASSNGDAAMVKRILQMDPTCVHAVDCTGGTALHSAARSAQHEVAALLLECGADVNARDYDGWSVLRAAAWAGHTQMVELLIAHGCTVDCIDGDGRTALRAASWSGHMGTVRALLAAGADVNSSDSDGRTALMAAGYMGHEDIVTHLLNNGADVNAADCEGRTALCVCAGRSGGSVAVLRALLEGGADVDAPDLHGNTPLIVASAEGDEEAVELLLEYEADMERADSEGRAALWAAAAGGHANIVKILLYWGASVGTVDPLGRTVLTAAAAHGNVEVVRQLLDRGLDEQHRDNSGWTPLHYAAYEGHTEVCEILLEAGGRVDETDNDGKAPLQLAAQEGHASLVELLVDTYGADVNQRAHDGKTAFRLAALEGHIETARCLQVRGADVNALDADGRSTLYAVCLEGGLNTATYLLTELRALHTPDPEGRTPLHVSAWQGHEHLIKLLIEVGGADVEAVDSCGRTALHAACWRGRAAAVTSLLAAGADVGVHCAQGATPLGIAAQEGHEQCVMLLLTAGADPGQPDHAGRTPISVARRAGHNSICRILESCFTVEHRTTSTGPTSVDVKHCTKVISDLRLSPLQSQGMDSPVFRRRCHSGTDKSRSQQLKSSRSSRPEREHTALESTAPSKDDRYRSIAECPGVESDEDYVFPGVLPLGRLEAGAGSSPLYLSPSTSPQHKGHNSCSVLPGDQHFNRDTHMRIILSSNKTTAAESSNAAGGNRSQVNRAMSRAYTRMFGSLRRSVTRRSVFKPLGKGKRNGIVTNPAMRLVANVRNGLDNAAANIRRTGFSSSSGNNPVVKTNAFQWRKETPL